MDVARNFMSADRECPQLTKAALVQFLMHVVKHGLD